MPLVDRRIVRAGEQRKNDTRDSDSGDDDDDDGTNESINRQNESIKVNGIDALLSFMFVAFLFFFSFSLCFAGL